MAPLEESVVGIAAATEGIVAEVLLRLPWRAKIPVKLVRPQIHVVRRPVSMEHAPAWYLQNRVKMLMTISIQSGVALEPRVQ
jgi:hypothetical protein